jgi:shikimate kinase
MLSTKNIFLIGFSGSGKSTVGPLLAERLKARFVDIDALVEKRAGKTIANIFARQGEAAFRRMERDAIGSLSKSRRRTVVALGGGAFENRSTRKLVSGLGRVVYLSCSQRELYRRLRLASDRPLLEVKPAKGQTLRQARQLAIAKLLDMRQANYRRADLVLSTTAKTPRQAAAELHRLLDRECEDN